MYLWHLPNTTVPLNVAKPSSWSCMILRDDLILFKFLFVHGTLLAIWFLLNDPAMTTPCWKWPSSKDYEVTVELGASCPLFRVLGCCCIIGWANIIGNVRFMYFLFFLLCLHSFFLVFYCMSVSKLSCTQGRWQWPMSQPSRATLRRGWSLPTDDYGFTVKYSADSLFVVRGSMASEVADLLPLPSCYWHPDGTWPSFS